MERFMVLGFIVIAVLFMACDSPTEKSELPNATANDASGEYVVFYGLVLSDDGPVPYAVIEVYCDTCGWNDITYADEYGVYEFRGGDHTGDSGSMMVGADGFYGTLNPYKSLPNKCNRMDLIIIPVDK